MLNFDQIYINQVLIDCILPKYSMKNIGIWYLSNILEIWAKTLRGGLPRLKFLGVTYEIPARKKLKIAFSAVTLFIVKISFEKYRYLLTHLLRSQLIGWEFTCFTSFSLVNFSNLNFTMKGATALWISFVTPENVNPGRPPLHVFAHISKIYDKYQMPIFFIEYLGSLWPVRTWLMCIWSKLSKN